MSTAEWERSAGPSASAVQRASESTGRQGTASDIFLESLAAHGVEYIFANFGTDHPGIIESLAQHQAPGSPKVPEVIIAQHEMVGISAAMGYAQITGRPQAVIVHVDVGTANLGSGVHNANRTRTPVLLFSGLAPLTAHGEMKGGKDNLVHYVQDVYDQSSIVREYIKWEYELRSPHNAAGMVTRALQMAMSAPKGPVYMTAAREVLEEMAEIPETMPPVVLPEQGLPDPAAIAWLLEALQNAENPLIVTSYLGQDKEAVPALVRFAERFGAAVCEIRVRSTNFPTDHPLHLGFAPAALAKDADLILMLESDVPWVPSKVKLRDDVKVARIDAEPLQRQIPYYPYPADRILPCNPRLLLEHLAETPFAPGEAERVESRRRAYADIHEQQRASWRAKANDGRLTAASLGRLVREIVGDAVFVGEAVTNAGNMLQQIPRVKPGRYIGNGGSGLGWGLGAALGAKLACPNDDVVFMVGDAAYFFGHPASVHWAQKAYKLPFLTVVYNNVGWQAVENATLDVHPAGEAARTGYTGGRFIEPPELSRLVAVADGYGQKVTTVDEAAKAIEEGLAAVRAGRPAVIDARIEKL